MKAEKPGLCLESGDGAVHSRPLGGVAPVFVAFVTFCKNSFSITPGLVQGDVSASAIRCTWHQEFPGQK
jgi:hypothetical protein